MDPEVQPITLWVEIMWAGEIAAALIILSALMIIVGVIFSLLIKPKKAFGIWILGTTIKLCLLSAGFFLFRDLILICHTTHPPWPAGLLIEMIVESLTGPKFFLGLALISFITKTLFQVKEKFANQKLEPTVKTPVE